MDSGYSDRLCPSHDYVQSRIKVANPEISDEEWLRLNPYGYLYIQNAVFPMLVEMGADKYALDLLFINGPRNFFEGI